MASWKTLLYGTMLAGGVATGMSGCAPKDKEPKENEDQQFKTNCTYSGFKSRMQPITPSVMLETILVEGVEFDDKGLCRPYCKTTAKGKDKYTIGFGLTSLDGKPVTANTRHITVKEAWEKSVNFYENEETYFFMWCYEIGIDGLHLDTQDKALGFASVMYNANTRCIQNPKDSIHCNRNSALRDLYERYGDDVTADQVRAVFAKYPIKDMYSFGKALNGGTVEDWANTLGNFCAEQGGMYWRRWLEGQIAMGNVTYQDLLDLPMLSMYEFWTVIGQDQTILFKKNKDGTARVNPEGLKRFKEWSKNPVDKNGNKIYRKTLRQVLNSIDTNLVSQVKTGTFSPKPNDTYFAMFEQIRKQYTCDAQNDISYIAYNNGEYDKALEAGKLALQLANTNKQYGAANFNIGITYSAMGKYDSAVHYLEQSLAYNERPVTKDSLNMAQQKLAEQQANAPAKHKKRGRGVATGFALGAGIVGAMYARKKYRAQRQR